MTDESLHPADVFRAVPGAAPTGGEFEVRRSPRTRVRAMLSWAAVAALLCAVPPIVVWWRNEPSYLVSGAWLIALIAAVVAVVVLLAIAWTGAIGRSGQVLNLDDDAITIGPASGHEPVTIAWADVRRAQIVGRILPSIVITPFDRDSADAASEEEAVDDETATADVAAPPVDFENDPPPPFVMPSADVFAQIRPVQNVTDDPQATADAANQTADESTSTDETASADAAAESEDAGTAAEDAEETPRGVTWNRRFYGTPYVVSLWGTAPHRRSLNAALAAYSERRFGATGAARKQRAGRR